MVFKLVSYEDASPEVKEIYDDTMKELGLPFVLNWFKCQGETPMLLKGNWEKLKSTLLRGTVPNLIKQLIIYNVSKKRGCSYCAQAHEIFANIIASQALEGFTGSIPEDIENEESILPASYRVAIKVVSYAALNSAKVTQNDFEELQVAGFDSQEIQELMAQADLVNMLNTLADISGIKIDRELLDLAG